MAEGARIEELRRRLEREPGSRLFAQLAEELRKGGDPDGAARVARRGLAQHPGYTSARLTLARALLELGEQAVARVELETVLRAAPDNILASRLLADCLVAMGDLGSALLQLRAVQRLSGGDRSIEAQIEGLENRLHGKRTGEPGAVEVEAAEAGGSVEETPAGATGNAVDVAVTEATGAEVVADPAGPQRRGGEAEWVNVGLVDGTVLSAWSPGESGDSRGTADVGRPPVVVIPGREGDAVEGEAGPTAEPPEVRAEDAPTVSSATLAELYFQQGSPERAREMYAELVRREPGNAKARLRLGEIEAVLEIGEGATVAGRREQVLGAISRLEKWLEAVEAASRRSRAR